MTTILSSILSPTPALAFFSLHPQSTLLTTGRVNLGRESHIMTAFSQVCRAGHFSHAVCQVLPTDRDTLDDQNFDLISFTERPFLWPYWLLGLSRAHHTFGDIPSYLPPQPHVWPPWLSRVCLKVTLSRRLTWTPLPHCSSAIPSCSPCFFKSTSLPVNLYQIYCQLLMFVFIFQNVNIMMKSVFVCFLQCCIRAFLECLS